MDNWKEHVKAWVSDRQYAHVATPDGQPACLRHRGPLTEGRRRGFPYCPRCERRVVRYLSTSGYREASRQRVNEGGACMNGRVYEWAEATKERPCPKCGRMTQATVRHRMCPECAAANEDIWYDPVTVR